MKNLKFLFKYFKNSKLNLILSFLCALVFVPCTLLIPFLTGKVVDVFTLIIENKITYQEYINLEINYIIYISLCIILVVIFQYIFESYVNIFIERIIVNIRNDLYSKLNSLPIKVIDSHLHGDLISRCINDVDNVSTGLINGYKQLFQGIITVIFTIFFMFFQNWLLGLIVLVFTPFGFFISYLIIKYGNKYFKKQAKETGDLSSIVLESFNNIEVIKSFNFEDESFTKFEKCNKKLYKAGQKAQFVSSLVNPSTRLITNSIYGIVGLIGALLVVYSGNLGYLGIDLTIGGIMSFLQYTNQFSKPLNEVSGCVSEIQTGMNSLKRIKEIIDLDEDIDNGETEVSQINKIELKNICFEYNNEKQIFKNLNLEIVKGKKVALVGPTGCGKTTIINLLLRFYDPNSGEILINNINNLDIKKSSLRNNLSMVLQDTWIFHGTVLDNIKFSKPDASLEEVKEACKKANCYDFIKRLPKGFDTVIDDESGLSNGEKQLLCIARMMLKDCDILILDEATSNVDTRTELKISQAMDNLMKGRTSIVIAHRLSTIKSSHLIYVLKDGAIIEKGKHEELLLKEGFYSKLYYSQFN